MADACAFAVFFVTGARLPATRQLTALDLQSRNTHTVYDYEHGYDMLLGYAAVTPVAGVTFNPLPPPGS